LVRIVTSAGAQQRSHDNKTRQRRTTTSLHRASLPHAGAFVTRPIGSRSAPSRRSD
jgi:hypothetical protein